MPGIEPGAAGSGSANATTVLHRPPFSFSEFAETEPHLELRVLLIKLELNPESLSE